MSLPKVRRGNPQVCLVPLRTCGKIAEVAYGSLQCARSMIVDGQILQVSCTGCQAVLPIWEVTAPLV